jgi:hypothetical protein
MTINDITVPADNFKIRCPKLGHEIFFSYCRFESGDLPCRKVLDCWYPYFEVERYFREVLTGDQWKALFESPPKPKMLTLLELIEQVKKRQKDKNND